MRNYGRMVMACATIISAVVCFAVSLEVGDRREQVQMLKRQIARDVKEMRRLQAEWQIRVRPAQLQRLNDSYFGLTAPTADRYFASAEAYVAFAADTDSVPQEPQVLPAIDTMDEPQPAPRTYLTQAGNGEARVVALSSDGPAVAMRVPAPSARPMERATQPRFDAHAAPRVQMASWSEEPAMPRAAAVRSGNPAVHIQLASWSPEPLPSDVRAVSAGFVSSQADRPRKAVSKVAEDAVASKPAKPKTEAVREERIVKEERQVASAAPARPKPAAPAAGRIGGLDSSTIASIERLTAAEEGPQ